MFNFRVYSDAAESWQLGLQDPASPAVEGMIFFHNYLCFFLIVIGVFVFWMLYKAVVDFDGKASDGSYSKFVKIPQRFTHSSLLEIIWTILPAVILILIAVPSFALLYSLDEILDPQITLKIDTYKDTELPEELRRIQPVKPGSRVLSK